MAKKKKEEQPEVSGEQSEVSSPDSEVQAKVQPEETIQEQPAANLKIVEETIETVTATENTENGGAEEKGAENADKTDGEASIDDKIAEMFPESNGDEKTQDEKIEEFLTEKGLIAPEETIPEGARKLAAGTIIPTNAGNVVLERETVIKHDGTESAFVGMLLSWNATNLNRNAANLRLKYNGNAQLLPLAQQCKPQELADFIPSLTAEEAHGMGVSRQAYDRYIAAKTAKETPSEETTENV
jgi:hypothetical protein